MSAAPRILRDLLDGCGLDTGLAERATTTGADPVLPCRYPVGEKAAALLAACGLAAAEIRRRSTGRGQDVAVDVKLAAAAMKSFMLQELAGKPAGQNPAAGNPLITLYPTADKRWLHIHGVFPHLVEGTLAVLGCGPGREEIAAAIASRPAQELEDALAARGMCGVTVRSAEEWLATTQGALLARTPVIEIIRIGDAPPKPLPTGNRPLSGTKVLDLTRILAGPTCARTLAEHGAEVLLVSGPGLPSIETCVTDTGHGKRAAALDLDSGDDRETLRGLVRQADVFSQGYRAGALERRGFGPRQLAELNPGIIAVSVNCYGHDGPWAARPGWEQLAQAATGWAVDHAEDGRPVIIEIAPCDYGTGYLAALGVMVAMLRRAEEGGSWHVRTSLCRTGMWLRDGARFEPRAATGIEGVEWEMVETETGFGRLRHLPPVVRMSETPAHWALPSAPLGSHPPRFGG